LIAGFILCPAEQNLQFRSEHRIICNYSKPSLSSRKLNTKKSLPFVIPHPTTTTVCLSMVAMNKRFDEEFGEVIGRI